jgi:hypothetical protein
MVKRRAVLLSILLLASCQDVVQMVFVFPANPIVWSFSCEFPERHKSAVRAGFEYWSKLLGKRLFIENDRCGVSDYFIPNKKRHGIAVVISDKPEYVVKGRQKLALWAAAPSASVSDEILSSMIVLYPMWQNSHDEGLRESVMRHEIGHVLGFGHSPDNRCLMYELIEPYEGLKGACSAEIEKFREIYK